MHQFYMSFTKMQGIFAVDVQLIVIGKSTTKTFLALINILKTQILLSNGLKIDTHLVNIQFYLGNLNKKVLCYILCSFNMSLSFYAYLFILLNFYYSIYLIITYFRVLKMIGQKNIS